MMMLMRYVVAVVAARTSSAVAVRVAAVRRAILLVYQVLDERHDRLALVRHRLDTSTRAHVRTVGFRITQGTDFRGQAQII